MFLLNLFLSNNSVKLLINPGLLSSVSKQHALLNEKSLYFQLYIGLIFISTENCRLGIKLKRDVLIMNFKLAHDTNFIPHVHIAKEIPTFY